MYTNRLKAAISCAPQISGETIPLLNEQGDYHPVTINPGHVVPQNAVEVPLDELANLHVCFTHARIVG